MISNKGYSIRSVVKDDCRLLWQWANDPASRASALESDSIPWETHVSWFENKMNDPASKLYLIEDSKKNPVAQIRFDENENGIMEVDIGVHPKMRQQGIGTFALKIAVARLFSESKVHSVKALIRPENKGSIRAFEKAGFARAGNEERKGCDCLIMVKEKKNYIVAGSRPWNKEVFEEKINCLPGSWHFIGSKDQLTTDLVTTLKPRYLFFLHWSWMVPEEIFSIYECVCFHMADVPFGRGGSPLQNLILRGFKETKLTALRMVKEMDAGPVYLKLPMSLDGSAEEIYIRSSRLAAAMIEKIIAEEMNPVDQSGQVTVFERRRPEESNISDLQDIEKLYDFIRMLDADGYPHAFLEHNGFRLEFSRASLKDGELLAHVTISKKS